MFNSVDRHSTQEKRLILVNRTTADQNFGLVADLSSIEVVPNVGASQGLAWKVAMIPGQNEGVSSRRIFGWSDRQVFVLGRLSRGARQAFSSEAILHLPPDGDRTLAMVGFVGTTDNGAAKLMRFEAGAPDFASLRTDGSIPVASHRSGTTRDLAVGVAIDPESDGQGAVISIPLAPHMAVSLKSSPIYRIVSLSREVLAGAVLSADVLAGGWLLDFELSPTIQLQYNDHNEFEPLSD